MTLSHGEPDPSKMSRAMREDWERMQAEFRAQEAEDSRLPFSGEAQWTGVYDEGAEYDDDPGPHVDDERDPYLGDPLPEPHVDNEGYDIHDA